jgi:hypothetical protein
MQVPAGGGYAGYGYARGMEPEPPEVESQQPTTAVQPSVRRAGALRRSLVVGLAIVGLLCLGGGTAAFLYYDRATKPDLRTPVLAAEQYLTAYLGDRDDAKAAQYRCADDSGLSDLRDLRSDIESREKDLHITFAVSVDSIRELSRNGGTALVSADLAITSTLQGQTRRELEHWEFTTRDEGGWRVCEGHEVT